MEQIAPSARVRWVVSQLRPGDEVLYVFEVGEPPVGSLTGDVRAGWRQSQSLTLSTKRDGQAMSLLADSGKESAYTDSAVRKRSLN